MGQSDTITYSAGMNRSCSLAAFIASAAVLAGCIGWYYLEQPDQPVKFLHLVSIVYCLVLNLLFYSNRFLMALPMLVLTVPGLVDDFMPSVFLGPTGERGASPYPIFSYLDLSLWMFFLYTLISDRRDRFCFDRIVKLLLTILAAVAVNILVNLSSDREYHAAYGVIWVVYYARFILIYLLLDRMIREREQFKQLVLGLALSIFVLLLDSAYITYAKGLHRLTAGTLGNNVFANLLAACCVVMFGLAMQLWRERRSRVSLSQVKSSYFVFTRSDLVSRCVTFSMFLAMAMILATKARMGLVALLLGFGVYWYLRNRSSLNLKKIAKLCCSFALLLAVLILVGKATPIFDRFQINLSDINTDNVEETKWSEGNTSIVTRILLWQSSARMIAENPLAGVGPGGWNSSKYLYGFRQKVLIDAHNGYLHYWAENGSIVMCLYLALIGATLLAVRRNLAWGGDNLLYLGFAAAFVSWLFTELTNAGINKSRVSTFVIVIIYVLVNFYKKPQTEPKHV